jgi:hypothetical protein
MANNDELKKALDLLRRKDPNNAALQKFDRVFRSYDGASDSAPKGSITLYNNWDKNYNSTNQEKQYLSGSGKKMIQGSDGSWQTSGYEKEMQKRKDNPTDYLNPDTVAKIKAQQDKLKQQVQQKKQQQQAKQTQDFKNKYIFGPQEWLYKHTLEPVEKKVERFLVSANDGITQGQFKKNLNTGGKKIGLEAPKFVQEATSKPTNKFDKAIDVTGEFAGASAPLMLSYGATAPILNPALKLLPQAGKIGMASKLLDSSIRGTAAMTAYGASREGLDAALHPGDSTLAERANRVKTDAMYGAIGDPLFRLGGMAAKKGIETAANSAMKKLIPTNEEIANAISSNVSKTDKAKFNLQRPTKNVEVPSVQPKETPANLVPNPKLSLKSIFGDLGPNGEVIRKPSETATPQVPNPADSKPVNPLQQEFDNAVQKQYDYLKNSMGKGVDYGTTGQGLGNFREVNGSFNVSRNPSGIKIFTNKTAGNRLMQN